MAMHKIPAEAFYIIQKIDETVRRETLLTKDAIIVAGVSGGVDSMLLLYYLAKKRALTPFDLTACHLDHQIRGEAAEADRRLVQSYCEAEHIPFRSFAVDVPAYAKKMKMGLEEAGRIKRREAFEQTGKERIQALGLGSAYRIALAHHRDDRAESILMHIGRGTGLRGLVGIRYHDGPYIRPLLDIGRDEVVAAARALQLPWRDDASNRSDEFLRNRVRHRLIPFWAQTIGYDPTAALIRLGDLAHHDDEALSALAEKALESSRLPDRSLSVSELVAMPYAIFSRVIQLYFILETQNTNNAARAPRQLRLSHVESLFALLDAMHRGRQTKAELSWPGDWVVLIAEGRLWLSSPHDKKD